jgi:hypothetical protein
MPAFAQGLQTATCLAIMAILAGAALSQSYPAYETIPHPTRPSELAGIIPASTTAPAPAEIAGIIPTESAAVSQAAAAHAALSELHAAATGQMQHAMPEAAFNPSAVIPSMPMPVDAELAAMTSLRKAAAKTMPDASSQASMQPAVQGAALDPAGAEAPAQMPLLPAAAGPSAEVAAWDTVPHPTQPSELAAVNPEVAPEIDFKLPSSMQASAATPMGAQAEAANTFYFTSDTAASLGMTPPLPIEEPSMVPAVAVTTLSGQSVGPVGEVPLTAVSASGSNIPAATSSDVPAPVAAEPQMDMGPKVMDQEIAAATSAAESPSTELLSDHSKDRDGGVAAQIAEAGRQARAAGPNNRTPVQVCAGQPYGPIVDPLTPHCWYWCQGPTLFTGDWGWHLCCFQAWCYQTPSLLFPVGACLPCESPPPPG